MSSSRFFILATPSGTLSIVFALRKFPLPLQLLSQIFKLALFHVLCDMRVDIHGGVKVGMTKDLLDDLNIVSVLK